MNDKCRAHVRDGWRHNLCQRTATRDGYCGQHHPDARASRQAKADARREARQAEAQRIANERREQIRRANCYDDLLAALKTLAAEEWRDDGDEVLEAARDYARAAIAKAES